MRALLPLCLILIAGPIPALADVALHADFNADTLFEEPDLSPPGDPAADALQIYAGQGSIEVVAEAGDLTDQPVRLNRAAPPGTFYFRGLLDPAYRDCGRYTVRWKSLSPGPQCFVSFTMRGGPNLWAGLGYRSGGVLSFNGSQHTLPVAWVEDVAQEFEVVLDFGTNTTTLQIDGVDVEAHGRGLYEGTFERFAVEFGCQNQAAMVLDDLEIIAENCTVATESIAWGTLKSRYGN